MRVLSCQRKAVVSRQASRLATSLLLIILGAGALLGQDRMQMVKVAEDVYVMVHPGLSSDAAFVITSEGVLVFDMHINTADQTLAAIRRLTDKKVVYLVSSHDAGDHATGGWYFREDNPTYIASKYQARSLHVEGLAQFRERAAGSDPIRAAYKGKELIPPDIGFEDSMTIYLGGLTFQLTWERTPKSYGHSRGDLTLYIPQRRVMFMGDLLNTEVHPGRGAVSHIQGWPEVLDMIIQRQLPVETFVPGHGPVHIGRGVADLEEQKRYFVVIQDEMTKMMQAGKSVEEIQKELEIPQEFAHYKGPDRLRFLLPFFYNQILDRGL